MVNWDEVNKIIFPIKSYEDVCQRLRISFGYAFVTQVYNMRLGELVSYTKRLLEGDPRRRYAVYASRLISVISGLQHAGLHNIIELKERTSSRDHLERFTDGSGVSAPDIAMLLKYLVYWIIPAEKYLSGLVRTDPAIQEAIQVLGEAGIRTNLQLLQAGITSQDRRQLEEKTHLTQAMIAQLVNRADFSRLPWASKATISNIIGAGYPSLASLANAEPDKLYADFFRYGKSIGKNLKMGNEIQSSYRIAQIVPKVVKEKEVPLH